MALKRSLLIDILAIQGVKVGHSLAFVDDTAVSRCIGPLLSKPPESGTTIEVEYVNGQFEAKLYR